MNIIYEIINNSKTLFFSDIVELLISIIAFFYCYKNKNKIDGFKSFSVYPLSSALQLILYIILSILNTGKDGMIFLISQISVTFFLLIEVYSLFFIFTIYTNTLKLKKIQTILVIIYTIEIARLHFFTPIESKFYSIYNLQSLVVLSLSTIQLIDIIKNKKNKFYFSLPVFWVVLGCYFYFLGTMPLFIIFDYIINNKLDINFEIYSINYISYSILFSLIIKATQCQKVMKS